MVTLSELKEKCRKFEEREGRASFYKLASEIKDDHPLQAAVIILATWNREIPQTDRRLQGISH
ncbi:MAG: hypothetical protein MW690_000334 [Methanophagales archaeon]|nr:hypothetical protein [Methanophagales archaeon]